MRLDLVASIPLFVYIDVVIMRWCPSLKCAWYKEPMAKGDAKIFVVGGTFSNKTLGLLPMRNAVETASWSRVLYSSL